MSRVLLTTASEERKNLEAIRLRVDKINLLLGEVGDTDDNAEDFFVAKELGEEKERLLRKFEALEHAISQREHSRVIRLLR